MKKQLRLPLPYLFGDILIHPLVFVWLRHGLQQRIAVWVWFVMPLKLLTSNTFCALLSVPCEASVKDYCGHPSALGHDACLSQSVCTTSLQGRDHIEQHQRFHLTGGQVDCESLSLTLHWAGKTMHLTLRSSKICVSIWVRCKWIWQRHLMSLVTCTVLGKRSNWTTSELSNVSSHGRTGVSTRLAVRLHPVTVFWRQIKMFVLIFEPNWWLCKTAARIRL